jgi:hypothetical protein
LGLRSPHTYPQNRCEKKSSKKKQHALNSHLFRALLPKVCRQNSANPRCFRAIIVRIQRNLGFFRQCQSKEYHY